MKKLLLTALLMFPVVGAAGPWCIWQNDTQGVCRFESAEECMEFAGTQGGYCRPNPNEFGAKGDAPLCLVTSTMRNCAYYSINNCRRAANRAGGGCVENTEKKLSLSKRKDGNTAFSSEIVQDFGGASP